MHNLNTESNTNETNLTNTGITMLILKHKLTVLFSISLLSLSGTTLAATDAGEGTSAYVDSVHGWGAWELGLEPAAGGSAPSPGRALASRSANVAFRPNDNSAFSPTSRRNSTPAPAGTPVGPIGPGGSLPTGNPADRFQ
jgi:hypothetical protein